MTPPLSLLAHSKNALLYTILLLGCISSVLPFFSRYVPSLIFLQSLFGAQALCGELLFFLLGYYLQYYVEGQKISSCVLVFAVCVILMIIATLVVNIDAIRQPGISYDNFFSNAFSIFSIGASSSLFLALKSIEPQLQQLALAQKNILQCLSSASLGVYVIHLLIMDNVAFLFPHPWSISMTIEPPMIYLVTVTIVIIAQSAWAAGKKSWERMRER